MYRGGIGQAEGSKSQAGPGGWPSGVHSDSVNGLESVNSAEDDRILAERQIAGDAEASRELYLRYRKAIMSLAFHALRDRGAAEDVLQETFLRVCRSMRSYDQRRPFSTWVLRVAINCCRDYRRRSPPSATLAETIPSGENVEAAVLRNEQALLLSRALGKLTLEDRILISLRYFHELDLQSMAMVLGKSPGCLAVKLHRLRKTLRGQQEWIALAK